MKSTKRRGIKPDYHNALFGWGTYIGYLAETKEGKEAEDLYLQAFEKYQNAIESGGSSYNLSCLYALKGEKHNALIYLSKSLLNNEIEPEFIDKDNDWNDFLNDQDFIGILSK